MYATGREALVQLGRWATERGETDMQLALSIWPSVYSVASVMANRASVMHLDSNGQPQWLDLLVTVGEHEELDMVLSTLGIRLRYNPGMVVAFPGSLLHHGVGHVTGNRGSIAFYMQQSVHEHVDIVRFFSSILVWLSSASNASRSASNSALLAP
ncbi:hypothetical protein L210DRAFT_3510290 [Boletus edulis BED1]|uniref:2OGFeDO JBP1/TET oxygenase domain-containing protein n=1 Tax=Boletus edulis BED1 TaxID=1328754 RepID=A0AAD4BDT4_BOLED|nr:hypothetical protein L210DRAFT_3510290 [Boletus edulis BED1]